MPGPRKLPLPKRLDSTIPERGAQPTFVPDQRGIPVQEQPVRRLPSSGGGIPVIVDPQSGQLARDPRFPEAAGTRVAPETAEQRLVRLLVGPDRMDIVRAAGERLGVVGPPTYQPPNPATAPRSVPAPRVGASEAPYSPEESLLRLLQAVRRGQITEGDAVEFANRMPEGTNLDSFLAELRRLRRER